MGISRDRDDFRENLGRSIRQDLFTQARLLDSDLLLHYVDAEVLNKCRVRTFKQQSQKIDHMTRRTDDANDMEKYRATKGDYGLDAREFALSDSVEKIYFDYYGEGFNGSPVIDKPGTQWVCPDCGMRYAMSLKTMKTECRICHHITPLGMLMRDGVMHR